MDSTCAQSCEYTTPQLKHFCFHKIVSYKMETQKLKIAEDCNIT